MTKSTSSLPLKRMLYYLMWCKYFPFIFNLYFPCETLCLNLFQNYHRLFGFHVFTGLSICFTTVFSNKLEKIFPSNIFIMYFKSWVGICLCQLGCYSSITIFFIWHLILFKQSNIDWIKLDRVMVIWNFTCIPRICMFYYNSWFWLFFFLLIFKICQNWKGFDNDLTWTVCKLDPWPAS